MKICKNLIGWIIFAVIIGALLLAGLNMVLVKHRILFIFILAIACLATVLFFGKWKTVDEKDMEE